MLPSISRWVAGCLVLLCCMIGVDAITSITYNLHILARWLNWQHCVYLFPVLPSCSFDCLLRLMLSFLAIQPFCSLQHRFASCHYDASFYFLPNHLTINNTHHPYQPNCLTIIITAILYIKPHKPYQPSIYDVFLPVISCLSGRNTRLYYFW